MMKMCVVSLQLRRFTEVFKVILQAWKLDTENNTFSHELDIDYATSIIWIQRYQDVGEFELYVRATAELIDLFKNEIFLIRSDSTYGMYVETVKLTTSVEDGDYLTVTGRSAELMTLWRVIQLKSYTSASITAEYIIRECLTTALIQSGPIFTSDNFIPFLSLETAHGWTDYVQRQFTGKRLYDIIQDLCITFGYGFRFVWNGAGFEVQLYKGTDRSYGQSENSYVIFSPAFDNLTSTEYIKDSSDYYNTAIIAGQGEGRERFTAYVFTDNNIEFKRRTLWIDARNSSKNQDGGELTDNQYRKQLQEQGRAAISEHKKSESFIGEVFTQGSFQYGVDYFLGDKVAVENEYGITGNATVTEITEVEDESGYRLVPTLSDWTVNEIEED